MHPPNVRFPVIIFDFDGVIADSFSVAFDVQRMICPHLTEREYRARFDRNINDWRGERRKHSRTCPGNIDFHTEYIPRFQRSVRLVPGIAQVIKTLGARYPLVIISSTPSDLILKFAVRERIMKYFREIMGNDVSTRKVDKIRLLLSQYKVVPENCILVTDTLGDIREAERAGVRSIGVSWGFQSPDTLAQGRPFRIARKPQDLVSAIEDYFSREPFRTNARQAGSLRKL